jgi:hypothetical protein
MASTKHLFKKNIPSSLHFCSFDSNWTYKGFLERSQVAEKLRKSAVSGIEWTTSTRKRFQNIHPRTKKSCTNCASTHCARLDWTEKIVITGTKIVGKLDTGAQSNVLPLRICNKPSLNEQQPNKKLAFVQQSQDKSYGWREGVFER